MCKDTLALFKYKLLIGGHVPIIAVGDIPGPIPLKNVYLCPNLTSNLLSVGQLVENNCNIAFSSSGLCCAGPNVQEEDREGA